MRNETSENEAIALKSEHASLNREIAEWRQWWSQLCEMGEPHFGEMGDRLAQFRKHLAAHFAHEESQGCLSLVMELSDDAVGQTADLRDEHPQLLRDLDQLISRLQQSQPEFDCWGKARDEFETFLDHLKTHEDAEETLLNQLP